MKKSLLICLSVLLFFSLLVSCQRNQVTTTHGVNAEILKIDPDKNILFVKGLDENSILGDQCYVNCENAEFMEVTDKEDLDIEFINLSDLSIGDQISIDVAEVLESYPTKTSTKHIQLLQRATQ